MNENSKQPAFPVGIPATEGNPSYVADGLTKREYFAAKAMQGLLANRNFVFTEEQIELIATRSIAMANELLKQL